MDHGDGRRCRSSECADKFVNSGKGTPRRKVKKVHKSTGMDDKKLQTSLKKLNVQPIQAIEEVNMFKADGNVIHFAAPKGTNPLTNGFHSTADFASISLVWRKLTATIYSPRCRPSQHIRYLR
jgi:hypothetical protein